MQSKINYKFLILYSLYSGLFFNSDDFFNIKIGDKHYLDVVKVSLYIMN